MNKRNIVFAALAASMILATGCTQKPETSSGGSAPSPSSNITAPETAETENSDNASTEAESKAVLKDYDGSAEPMSVLTGGMLCSTDKGLLYSDGAALYLVNGEESTKLYDGKASHINFVNGRVTFIGTDDKGSADIYLMLDLESKASCGLKCSNAVYLASAEHGNYYIDADHKLHRVFGSDTVISDNQPESVSVAGKYVIWTEAKNDFAVIAYDSETGQTETIVENGNRPTVDGNTLYFTNEDSGITALDLTNGETSVVSDKCRLFFIPANDVIYYAEGASICTVPVSGGEAETVYTAENSEAVIKDLTIHDGKLYFTEDGAIKSL